MPRAIVNRLGRPAAHRLALVRNQVTSLIKHERIRTTLTKAKELRRHAEAAVTWAKDGSLHARREAAKVITEDLMLQKLFYDLGERYASRSGGYTRVMRDGFRKGDGAPMAVIEFVDRDKGPFTQLPKHFSVTQKVYDELAERMEKAGEQAGAAASEAPSSSASAAAAAAASS